MEFVYNPLCSTPSEILRLEHTEVHIWRASLNQSPTQINEFLGMLTPDEKVKANRFHSAKKRNQFIVAHGLLRVILGCYYINTAPEQLRFFYNSYGKPYITDELNKDKLKFNMSHSHGIVLYAFTSGREVGVDIEYIRPDIAYEQIAERFFSQRELTELQSLPQEKQKEAFFYFWTCKEAYLKARGEGISLPFDSFEVSMIQGKPVALLSTKSGLQGISRWSILNLQLKSGYIGVLVVEGNNQENQDLCLFGQTLKAIS